MDAKTLKMIQENEKRLKQQKLNVHCPYCNSTNVKKISTMSKATSIVGLGILSKKIGKQWHCDNCKSDF